jgi:ribose transport system substrate-binding protein
LTFRPSSIDNPFVLNLRRAGLLVAALAAFTGCKSSSSSATPSRIVGVTLHTKTHPFYKQLEKGLRDQAAKDGLTLKVQSAEFDTATQTAQIENFITQKVAAIVLCPVDSQAVGGAVKRANEAAIPVFTADIRSLSGNVVSHVASNNEQGGRLIGEYLAHALGEKGKIAIIDYPEVTSSQERVKGFEAAIKRFPELSIVAKVSGLGVRDRAAVTMENILEAHPDLRAVFGINDNTALGALSVLQARGRKDVLIVGFDADDEARDAIRKGLILADAAQAPERIGAATADAIAAHLDGKPVTKEVAIETFIVDKAALAKP